MKKRLLVLILGAVLLSQHQMSSGIVPRLRLPAVNASWNVGENLSFEGGEWSNARHWHWPWHDPDTSVPQEVRCPDAFTCWYVEGEWCWGYEPNQTAQPEILVFDSYKDPVRVQDGEKSAKWFTFWRCHHGGLFQVVQVPYPGYYRFSVRAHHWYSDCSDRPHDQPLRGDCISPLPDAATIRLGIDPRGGQDYWSDGIVWSDPAERYGTYGAALVSPVVYVRNVMTIWMESQTMYPAKHEDVYFDDVKIWKVVQ